MLYTDEWCKCISINELTTVETSGPALLPYKWATCHSTLTIEFIKPLWAVCKDISLVVFPKPKIPILHDSRRCPLRNKSYYFSSIVTVKCSFLILVHCSIPLLPTLTAIPQTRWRTHRPCPRSHTWIGRPNQGRVWQIWSQFRNQEHRRLWWRPQKQASAAIASRCGDCYRHAGSSNWSLGARKY